LLHPSCFLAWFWLVSSSIFGEDTIFSTGEVAGVPMASSANQNKFLGTLLGMGIGDALGMPVRGDAPEEIAARFGRISGFHPRQLDAESEIKAGEFTDESEIALCIVEAATANDGQFDPDLIGPRMLFLARGESKRWMHPDTLHALERSEDDRSFVQPLSEAGPASADVAVRGVPIGLLHAVGNKREAELIADVENVVRITHGSPLAISGATAVALGVSLAARGGMEPRAWAHEVAMHLMDGDVARALRSPAGSVHGDDIVAVITTAFDDAARAISFEDAVFQAVNRGGPADTRGALTGALAGARFGADGIPQRLIDESEGRIYVSLAVPWFYRAANRRAGRSIELKRDV
jgi:ADP-ribosyl-[dinitrogen reductase] hydrolase